MVIRNNIPIAEIQKYPIKGIVLSPGPGKPTDAGHMMNLLSTYHLIVPILGICLGHQALGIHFGADLMKAKKPMHGKTSLINIQSDYIFKGLPPQFNIVRYHSLILKNLPECLEIISVTKENEIMAFRHKLLNIRGIQYHPEAALTEFGFEILRNWIDNNFRTVE